jgi:hypothetical protein
MNAIPLTLADTQTGQYTFHDTGYFYDKKMVIAGRKITVKKYAHPIRRTRKGIQRKPRIRTGRIVALTTEQTYKRRQDNQQRSKNNFENKVHTNYPLTPTPYRAPVEITLTYARTMLDRRQAIKDWQDFTRSMQREYGNVAVLLYVAVLERQKERGLKEGNEGTWHIHAIFFNLPYNPSTSSKMPMN